MSFWNFIVNKKDDNSEEVELRIEGDIIDDDDMWLYEWFDIKATAPNAFRQELKQYKKKNITVWIDSYGGSVFAATGIYNALKEHKGKITVKIDGKAMSAATLIAMAGDEILMSPSAIFMIHNPLLMATGYANDLRKAADILDEVKEAIINAYELKTGRDRADISQLMENETYMSAKTAIKEGFADSILYDEDSALDDNKNINNFMFNRLAIVNSTNADIKKIIDVKKKAEKPKNKTEQLSFMDLLEDDNFIALIAEKIAKHTNKVKGKPKEITEEIDDKQETDFKNKQKIKNLKAKLALELMI